jgi:biopolymer transport protein ExbB
VNIVEIIKQLFLRSGAGWVLWFLGALSIFSAAIIVERWLHLRARRGDLKQLAADLDGWLSRGEWEVASRELSRSTSVAATIAAAGRRLAERGPAAADKAMQSAVALVRTQLERGLTYLATVGNNAPFVGLLGTVIGVVHAFEELGHGTPHHGAGQVAQTVPHLPTPVAGASHVASEMVMASIAEALVATAVGLFVALPAVAAYNALQRRVTSLLNGTDVLSNLVLAYLSDRNVAVVPGATAAPAPAVKEGS